MAGAVAVVLALRAEQEAVQSAVLAHGVESLPPSGEKLVDVTLMADVEDEFVLGGVENPVQRDGQFDYAQIRAEMPADGVGIVLGEDADEFLADFLGEFASSFRRAS